MNAPDPHYVSETVASALREDIGPGDLTAQLIPADRQGRASVITREEAVVCGRARVEWRTNDCDRVRADETLFTATGPARAMLTAERTALNFLQLLSSTATITRRYVDAVAGTSCQILDTRKTIPGMRVAQKYAVRCGGGVNHRIGLFDAMLVKENHIAAAGSIAAAVSAGRRLNDRVLLEVEVENFAQLEQALDARVDRILLDNFSLEDMRRSVQLAKTHRNAGIKLEASGNMSLESLRHVAQTGVDYISVGGLTKHVKAVDLSMRFE
jgi:nicotinate-nucleotide pyrophosphorylase (carboxylating)